MLKFANAYRVAEQVQADRGVLTKFFDQYDHHRLQSSTTATAAAAAAEGFTNTAATTTGVASSSSSSSSAEERDPEMMSPHKKELRLLRHLCAVLEVSDGDFSSVGEEIQAIFDRYSVDGLRALQSVLQAHPGVCMYMKPLYVM